MRQYKIAQELSTIKKSIWVFIVLEIVACDCALPEIGTSNTLEIARTSS